MNRLKPYYRKRYSRKELIKVIKGSVESVDDSSLVDMANLLDKGDFYSPEKDVYIESPYFGEEDATALFEEVIKGDPVIVIPTVDNEFQEEFSATVVGFKKNDSEDALYEGRSGSEDLVVVIDQENNAWDVNPEEIRKDE